MQNKGISSTLVLLIVLAVAVIGGCVAYYFVVINPKQGSVACTMEAKVCPDGTAVGRTGPNCEFAQCPDQTSGWKTYTNTQYGFAFKYPEIFSGVTWSPIVWPPYATSLDKGVDPTKACGADISRQAQNGPRKNETINGMNFVVYESNDVGAGQLYSEYCYILDENNKNYVIDFLIHSTSGCGNGNCGPYCGTENEQACKNFDIQKEIIQPIEEIISTFKFIN